MAGIRISFHSGRLSVGSQFLRFVTVLDKDVEKFLVFSSDEFNGVALSCQLFRQDHLKPVSSFSDCCF